MLYLPSAIFLIFGPQSAVFPNRFTNRSCWVPLKPCKLSLIAPVLLRLEAKGSDGKLLINVPVAISSRFLKGEYLEIKSLFACPVCIHCQWSNLLLSAGCRSTLGRTPVMSCPCFENGAVWVLACVFTVCVHRDFSFVCALGISF